MNKITSSTIKKIIASIILILPLALYGWRASLRPPLVSTQKDLFKGITYTRKVNSKPRPFITHIIKINLTTAGIKPFVTPPKPGKNSQTNLARTTSSFAKEYNLQLAVNGSFFFPFHERVPWDYYPKERQDVHVLGQSTTENITYGSLNSRRKALCFAENNLAQIVTEQKCPKGTVQGIGGMGILVLDNQSQVKSNTPSYARNLVATNKKGDVLWLVLVDGKQPFYSEGVTLKELADIAVNLGADRALNLDGGGSTTLVINDGSKTKIINAPIHSKIPMNERPVANHLGFYAELLNPNTLHSENQQKLVLPKDDTNYENYSLKPKEE